MEITSRGVTMKRTNLVIVMAVLFTLCGMAGCAGRAIKEKQAAARLDIGTEYLRSSRYTLALNELLKAKELDPGNPEIRYYLGMSYDKKGGVKKAIAEFEKAVKLNHDYSEAHNYLGVIYLRMEHWDKAIEEFNKALLNICYPTPATALYNLGRAYHGKGDCRSALNKYAEAKIREPNTVYLPLIEMYTGIIHFNWGEINKAAKHFERSILLFPPHVEPHFWLGKCYVKQKNMQGAMEEFRTVIEMAPLSELGEKARKSLEAIEGDI